MAMNAVSAVDPFEVWFVPAIGASLRLGAPLRVGQPLSDQEDAQVLAEVAATDLPAYGFPRGQVLIQTNASVVRVLPTTPRPAGRPAPRVTDPSRDTDDTLSSTRSHQEVARMALEDLRQQVSRARPDQPAPAAWLACLDRALRVIASPEDPAHAPRDRQLCPTVAALQERVNAILDRLDLPVA